MERRAQRVQPAHDALQLLRALELDGRVQPHFCGTGLTIEDTPHQG